MRSSRRHPDEATAERKIKTLVRLFGISVTIGFVLTLTNIVLDLFAFQCGSLPACAAQRWWLTPFEGLPDSPGARLAIGTGAEECGDEDLIIEARSALLREFRGDGHIAALVCERVERVG